MGSYDMTGLGLSPHQVLPTHFFFPLKDNFSFQVQSKKKAFKSLPELQPEGPICPRPCWVTQCSPFWIPSTKTLLINSLRCFLPSVYPLPFKIGDQIMEQSCWTALLRVSSIFHRIFVRLGLLNKILETGSPHSHDWNMLSSSSSLFASLTYGWERQKERAVNYVLTCWPFWAWDTRHTLSAT